MTPYRKPQSREMKTTNRVWAAILSLIFLGSMALAWNQRIPDPWGLWMVLISALGLTTAIVIGAVQTARRARAGDNA